MKRAKLIRGTWSNFGLGTGGQKREVIDVVEDLEDKDKDREPLKGSSQVVRICGGKIAFACLKKVNKTQLSHLISHNLGRAF